MANNELDGPQVQGRLSEMEVALAKQSVPRSLGGR